MNQSRTTKRRRKRKLAKRISLVFGLALLIVVGYFGYLAFTVKSAADKSYDDLNREKSEQRVEKVTLGEDPVTILLVGVEDYQDDTGRSDALILITLNPKTKEVVTLSIPRDTRTYIEVEDRKDKINHSYAYGGLEATIETVESMLDIPVDYYVETNIKGFQEIVDELGGITVDVPFDFRQQAAGNHKWFYFQEGEMHLGGIEALAFVQMRKQDPRGDFGRQDRQQEALRAIADKALSISSITKADDVIDAVSDNTRTNITLRELLGMRNFYSEIKNKEITRLNIKGEDKYINDIYYYVPFEESIDEISDELKRVLEIDENSSVNASGTTKEKELAQ